MFRTEWDAYTESTRADNHSGTAVDPLSKRPSNDTGTILNTTALCIMYSFILSHCHAAYRIRRKRILRIRDANDRGHQEPERRPTVRPSPPAHFENRNKPNLLGRRYVTTSTPASFSSLAGAGSIRFRKNKHNTTQAHFSPHRPERTSADPSRSYPILSDAPLLSFPVRLGLGRGLRRAAAVPRQRRAVGGNTSNTAAATAGNPER